MKAITLVSVVICTLLADANDTEIMKATFIIGAIMFFIATILIDVIEDSVKQIIKKLGE